MYDAAAAFWMELRTELENATTLCGNSGMCKAERCKEGHVCSPVSGDAVVSLPFCLISHGIPCATQRGKLS